MTQSAFQIDQTMNDSQLIAADHPYFYYIGRIDARNPKNPVFIWQGSQLRTRFSGEHFGIRFSDAQGQNFYNVIIDGEIHLLKLTEGGSHDYWYSGTLSPGVHELTLFKRSEGYFGQATFLGLLLGGHSRLEAKPAPLLRCIDFYGDSITVGACNEDPGSDQWDDFATHNNYLAYGAITARALDAEYRCLAVSGIGICYSWNPVLMPQIYDKISWEPGSPRYDLNCRQPDLVVINLGTNDCCYPRSIGLPFPADFSIKYQEFVAKIRALYPEAPIICAIGGTIDYWNSPEFQAAYSKAVAELTKNDSRIYSFIFRASSEDHPRVAVHQQMAEELLEFINKEIF